MFGRTSPRLLLCCASGLLVVACAGAPESPSAVDRTNSTASSSAAGKSSDGDKSATDGGSRDSSASDGGAPGSSASDGRGRGGSASAGGRGDGDEATGPSRSRTRPPTSGQPTRTSGPSTVVSPLNIPDFLEIIGSDWAIYEEIVEKGLAKACGSLGPKCVTIRVAVEHIPEFFSPEDCPINDVRWPQPMYPGDVYAVTINDPCHNGYPPRALDGPDITDLRDKSWSDVEATVKARLDEVCGEFGPGCLTLTTEVDTESGGQQGDLDCALRNLNRPLYLFAEDLVETPEQDDAVIAVLSDACGPG